MTRQDESPEAARSRGARDAQAFPIYASMLYLGLLCALVTADVTARLLGLSPARVLTAALILVPLLLGGARVLAVALNWSYYRSRPREILRVDHGGAALYGALPPAWLASVPLLHWLDLPLGSFWDVVGVAMLVGMIPTRFGCLGAGCCRGRLVEWRGRRLRLPNQMLEALLGLSLLAFLALFGARLPFPGAIFLVALGGYAMGRFGLEFLREERLRPALGLTSFQWMSAALAIGAAALLVLGRSEDAGPAIAMASVDPALGPAAGRLLVAGLALVPIMILFRFLGCSLLLSTADVPTLELKLNAAVPDIGGPGDFEVTMTIETEEDGQEIDESPVELDPAGNLQDGRAAFEKRIEIPEGNYSVSCLVTRENTLSREGDDCTGSLNAPDLEVRYVAEEGDPLDELRAQLCFEEAP